MLYSGQIRYYYLTNICQEYDIYSIDKLFHDGVVSLLFDDDAGAKETPASNLNPESLSNEPRQHLRIYFQPLTTKPLKPGTFTFAHHNPDHDQNSQPTSKIRVNPDKCS